MRARAMAVLDAPPGFCCSRLGLRSWCNSLHCCCYSFGCHCSCSSLKLDRALHTGYRGKKPHDCHSSYLGEIVVGLLILRSRVLENNRRKKKNLKRQLLRPTYVYSSCFDG